MADPSRPVYLEKTPAHIHFVPTILSLYPDARIVHIVRNPFQIAQSYRRMLRLQGKPLRSTYEVTRIWKASLRMAQAHQLLTVRYEDLVADTGKEMERVGEYLGLAYSAALLARQHEQSRHSVLETESWKGNNYRGIQGISSSTPVSAEDRTVIGLCCGAEMARWGYDRPSGAGAPSSLLRQTLAYGLMRGQAMYAQWRTER